MCQLCSYVCARASVVKIQSTDFPESSIAVKAIHILLQLLVFPKRQEDGSSKNSKILLYCTTSKSKKSHRKNRCDNFFSPTEYGVIRFRRCLLPSVEQLAWQSVLHSPLHWLNRHLSVWARLPIY